MVTSPNPNMQIASQTRGFIFLSRMFEGISNRIYGIKKMTSAMLYLLPLRRFNSLDNPKTFALAMLTLIVIVKHSFLQGLEKEPTDREKPTNT